VVNVMNAGMSNPHVFISTCSRQQIQTVPV
jgi:hypothetical protein